MNQTSRLEPINWYWLPIDRKLLGQLTCKSDWRGLVQTSGFLGILALTEGAAYYSGGHWPWYATLALLYVHGTCWAFVSNGFHEFSHGTVFATRRLNDAFLGLFSFMSWINPVLFWTSHTDHHKYTLQPAGDLEIDINARPTLRGFLLDAFVSPRNLFRTVGMNMRHAFGRLEGDWENQLFPPSEPELRRQLARWARILLAGHAAVIGLAIYYHLWMLIVVFSLAKFYGGGLQCGRRQLELPVDDN